MLSILFHFYCCIMMSSVVFVMMLILMSRYLASGASRRASFMMCTSLLLVGLLLALITTRWLLHFYLPIRWARCVVIIARSLHLFRVFLGRLLLFRLLPMHNRVRLLRSWILITTLDTWAILKMHLVVLVLSLTFLFIAEIVVDFLRHLLLWVILCGVMMHLLGVRAMLLDDELLVLLMFDLLLS